MVLKTKMNRKKETNQECSRKKKAATVVQGDVGGRVRPGRPGENYRIKTGLGKEKGETTGERGEAVSKDRRRSHADAKKVSKGKRGAKRKKKRKVGRGRSRFEQGDNSGR